MTWLIIAVFISPKQHIRIKEVLMQAKQVVLPRQVIEEANAIQRREDVTELASLDSVLEWYEDELCKPLIEVSAFLKQYLTGKYDESYRDDVPIYWDIIEFKEDIFELNPLPNLAFCGRLTPDGIMAFACYVNNHEMELSLDFAYSISDDSLDSLVSKDLDSFDEVEVPKGLDPYKLTTWAMLRWFKRLVDSRKSDDDWAVHYHLALLVLDQYGQELDQQAVADLKDSPGVGCGLPLLPDEWELSC